MSKDIHERAGWTKVKRGPFAGNLRCRRKDYRWTQTQLAAAVGVGQSQVSNWERGKGEPNLEQLRRVGKVLDMPVGMLLGDEGSLR